MDVNQKAHKANKLIRSRGTIHNIHINISSDSKQKGRHRATIAQIWRQNILAKQRVDLGECA
jgi:hypothetical protein